MQARKVQHVMRVLHIANIIMATLIVGRLYMTGHFRTPVQLRPNHECAMSSCSFILLIANISCFNLVSSEHYVRSGLNCGLLHNRIECCRSSSNSEMTTTTTPPLLEDDGYKKYVYMGTETEIIFAIVFIMCLLNFIIRRKVQKYQKMIATPRVELV